MPKDEAEELRGEIVALETALAAAFGEIAVLRAAVRAAAAACLPSLPAPMLAEVVAAVAPAEPPPPKHVMPNVAPADAGRLAQRLALLTGNGTNLPPGAVAGRLAKRLASSGAARIRAD